MCKKIVVTTRFSCSKQTNHNGMRWYACVRACAREHTNNWICVSISRSVAKWNKIQLPWPLSMCHFLRHTMTYGCWLSKLREWDGEQNKIKVYIQRNRTGEIICHREIKSIYQQWTIWRLNKFNHTRMNGSEQYDDHFISIFRCFVYIREKKTYKLFFVRARLWLI